MPHDDIEPCYRDPHMAKFRESRPSEARPATKAPAGSSLDDRSGLQGDRLGRLGTEGVCTTEVRRVREDVEDWDAWADSHVACVLLVCLCSRAGIPRHYAVDQRRWLQVR